MRGKKGGEGEGDRRGRHYTPEERRQAVEAFGRSGLTKRAFAVNFGVSEMSLHSWIKAYETSGPKGLERLAKGPVKRRGRAALPAPLVEEVVAVKRRFPTFGLRKVRDFLWRFSGMSVSTGSVRKVFAAQTPPLTTPATTRRRRRRHPVGPPQRFERAGPNELWQTDITYVDAPWSRTPLYLVAFLDDHSRYVVSFGLYAHQKAEIVLEALAQGISRYGRPKEVLSDQGRQYYAWRGQCTFQKRLKKEGIQHVIARAHHPQTVGKCERLWKTLQDELWSRVMLRDLDDARERLARFLDHYNFQRPHQGLDGQVPADRFFGAKEEVRRAIEKAVEKNALHLAVGETPRKPLYLAGQIDGQSVSVHGEGGRVVVHLPDGQRHEIDARDLGVKKSTKEEEHHGDGEQQGDGEHRDEHGDQSRDEPRGDGGDGGAEGGGVAGGGSGGGPQGPPNAPGVEANDVSGAEEDAGAGAGAVAGGERGAEGASPHDGGDDPKDLARPGDA